MRLRLGLLLAALAVQPHGAPAQERAPLELTIGKLRDGAPALKGSLQGLRGGHAGHGARPTQKPAHAPRQQRPESPVARTSVDPVTTAGIPAGSYHSAGPLRQSIVAVDGTAAVAMAIASSALLRSYLADEDAAAARVLGARLAFVPSLTASLRLTDGPEDFNSLGNPTVQGGLSLTATIFDGGRRINALRGARSALAGAVHDAEAARNQIAAETLATIVELDFAQSQAAILSGSLRELGGTLAAVRARRNAGLASEGEVAEVEAEIAELRRGLAAAEGAAAKAGAGLRGQLGAEVAGVPSMPHLEGLLAMGPERLAEQARLNNPRVLATWNRATAASFSHKAALGKYLPRLEFAADYGAYRNFGPQADPSGLTVGLTLRVPLVQASTVAEVREARALAAAARYRAIDEAIRFDTQVRVDWAEHQAAGERETHAARKVAALRRALASRRAQYDAGLIPVDDVLVLSRQVAQARVQEAEARSQRVAVGVALAAGAGLLVPQVDGHSAYQGGYQRAPVRSFDQFGPADAAGLPGVSVRRRPQATAW